MKTLLQLLTVLLLVAITVWHLFCAMFAIYVALMGGQPLALAILVVILFPPFVLIRQAVRKRWTTADVILVSISILPGIVLGFQEIMRPRSPNVPWLIPVLLAYALAPVLVWVMARIDDQRNHSINLRAE
jgi:hypothetical protein